MIYPISITTNLCYILRNDSEVLLAFKKKGFGIGKWNGPGGKVMSDESPLESVIREVQEEVGLKVINLQNVGYLEFIWPSKMEHHNNRCNVYLAKQFQGSPRESEECLPKWFRFDQVPYNKMWPDDKIWLPDILASQTIKKRFFFNAKGGLIKFEDIS